MRIFSFCLVIIFSIFSLSKEIRNADAQAIAISCRNERQIANCGNEKVGTGLIKCLQKYKQENADFIFSGPCDKSIDRYHDDKKEKQKYRESKKQDENK